VHPTHLLPVRGWRAPSRRQGTREGIHSEARWRAFYAERKCEFRILFSARAAQNEFFYSTLLWTPFSGERPPYSVSPISSTRLPGPAHSDRDAQGYVSPISSTRLPGPARSAREARGNVTPISSTRLPGPARTAQKARGSVWPISSTRLPGLTRSDRKA